jgi:predicted O-methyltransferase YrrM
MKRNCLVSLSVIAVLAMFTQPLVAQPGDRQSFGMPSGSELIKPPLPKDDTEKRILGVLKEMSEGEWYANVSPTDGRYLRLLTETIGAKRVVELGTSSGYSGIWFALALRKTGGHLYTHEIDEDRVRMARENFKKAGVSDLVTVIPGDAHETVKQHEDPIDLLFLDADKEGYIDYLDKLLPLVRPGGLIVAHNMRVPTPDPRYIEAITTNPDLETSFVLMEGAGIGVTLKKR